eukprot:365817-Chlamydomonas_euryale.AAC.14
MTCGVSARHGGHGASSSAASAQCGRSSPLLPALRASAWCGRVVGHTCGQGRAKERTLCVWVKVEMWGSKLLPASKGEAACLLAFHLPSHNAPSEQEWSEVVGAQVAVTAAQVVLHAHHACVVDEHREALARRPERGALRRRACAHLWCARNGKRGRWARRRLRVCGAKRGLHALHRGRNF